MVVNERTLMTDDVIFQPEGPIGVVVLLHGLGMKPSVLAPFAEVLGPRVVVCVPHGPVDEGDGARAWWPVDSAKRSARLAAGPSDLFDRHPTGRAAARAALAAVLARLRVRFPGLPVLLAGFSQGGMLASEHLFFADSPGVAGLALLSSTRIAFDEWQPRLARAAGLPVLVAHGRADADLGFAAGVALRDAYITGGARVTWLAHDGGHGLPLVVWRGLRRFVTDCFGEALQPRE